MNWAILLGSVVAATVALKSLPPPKVMQDDKQLPSTAKKEVIANEEIIRNEQNGLGEYLKVTINLPIEKNGMYKVCSILRTEEEGNIGQGRLAPMPHMKLAMILPPEEVQLQQGEEKITVYFDGQDIADKGVDGNYQVIVYVSNDKEQFARSIEYTTQYYHAKDFGIN